MMAGNPLLLLDETMFLGRMAELHQATVGWQGFDTLVESGLLQGAPTVVGPCRFERLIRWMAKLASESEDADEATWPEHQRVVRAAPAIDERGRLTGRAVSFAELDAHYDRPPLPEELAFDRFMGAVDEDDALKAQTLFYVARERDGSTIAEMHRELASVTNGGTDAVRTLSEKADLGKWLLAGLAMAAKEGAPLDATSADWTVGAWRKKRGARAVDTRDISMAWRGLGRCAVCAEFLSMKWRLPERLREAVEPGPETVERLLSATRTRGVWTGEWYCRFCCKVSPGVETRVMEPARLSTKQERFRYLVGLAQHHRNARREPQPLNFADAEWIAAEARSLGWLKTSDDADLLCNQLVAEGVSRDACNDEVFPVLEYKDHLDTERSQRLVALLGSHGAVAAAEALGISTTTFDKMINGGSRGPFRRHGATVSAATLEKVRTALGPSVTP